MSTAAVCKEAFDRFCPLEVSLISHNCLVAYFVAVATNHCSVSFIIPDTEMICHRNKCQSLIPKTDNRVIKQPLD